MYNVMTFIEYMFTNTVLQLPLGFVITGMLCLRVQYKKCNIIHLQLILLIMNELVQFMMEHVPLPECTQHWIVLLPPPFLILTVEKGEVTLASGIYLQALLSSLTESTKEA